MESCSLVIEPNDNRKVAVTFRVTNKEYLPLDKADKTHILLMPDTLGGALRVSGPIRAEMSYDVDQFGMTLSIEMYVKGWYSTYEEAAAAEMQEKMEKS